MPKTKVNEYTAADIQVLEGLEAVRRRPSMYIGCTDSPRPPPPRLRDRRQQHRRGDGRLLRPRSTSASGPTARVVVSDNGRGIPIDKHARTGKSALETVMTYLHAGGKFDRHAYKVSGGLHGVGAAVVNALSSDMWVEVRRDGKVYRQEYARGKAKGQLKVVGNGADEQRHHHRLRPRPRDLPRDRVRLRDAGPALPRDGLPHQGRLDPLHGRARRPRGELLLRGRHQVSFVRRLNRDRDGPPRPVLHGARRRRHRRRGRAPVQR